MKIQFQTNSTTGAEKLLAGKLFDAYLELLEEFKVVEDEELQIPSKNIIFE